MKNNLFDYLENAEENEIMKLNDQTPEFNDNTLEKLLEMSERKYELKKNDTTDNIENTVEGVEKYSRPVWIRTVCTAASLVLIAGGAILSLAIMKHNNPPTPNDPQPPYVASPTESASTDTTPVSTAEFTKLGTGTGTVTTAVEGATQNTVSNKSTATNAPNEETNAVQQETAAPNDSDTQSATTPAIEADKDSSDKALKEKLISVFEEYLETTDLFSDASKVDFNDSFYVTDRFRVFINYEDHEGHIEETQIKYVHYDDTRFHSFQDIRNYTCDPFVFEPGGSDKFVWYDDLYPGRVIDDTNSMIGTSGGQPYCVYNDKVYVLASMFEDNTTWYRQREILTDKNNVNVVSIREYEYDPFVGYECAEITCNCIIDAYTEGTKHNMTGRIQFLNIPEKGWKILSVCYEEP